MYIESEIEKYCLSSCLNSNENLYLDRDTKTCYKNCSEASDSKIYAYEQECISECPKNYYVNSDNICVNKNNGFKLFGLLEVTDIIKIIEDLNNTTLTSDTKVKVQNFLDDTIVSCYSTKTDLNDLIKSNSSLTYTTNFKECEKLIKKEYELDEDSDLFIIAKESKSKSSKKVTNDYEYEVFIKEGKRLNSSICDNIDIEISSPINNIDLINLEKARILAKQGYDIYNLSSDFYYDYCLAAYINNSDLTLDVREEDIYPSNVTLCSSGCKYNGIDLEILRVNCVCNKEYEKEEIETVKEEVEQNFFIYIASMINYQIISCYHNIVIINCYINNYGFFVCFFLFILILIDLLIYQFRGRKVIKRIYFKKEPKDKETNNTSSKIINLNLFKKYFKKKIKKRRLKLKLITQRLKLVPIIKY